MQSKGNCTGSHTSGRGSSSNVHPDSSNIHAYASSTNADAHYPADRHSNTNAHPCPAAYCLRSDRDGEFDIYVMNADGSDLTRLTDDPAWDGLPAWSPDGRQIAFSSDRNGNMNIYVMNADGSDLTQLTDLDHASVPVWSPDDQQIAFKSVDDQGNYDIYVMNADGSDLTRLAGGLDYADFSNFWFLLPEPLSLWSPDGEQLAVMSGHDDAGFDIYVVNADGSGLTRLTYDIDTALFPVWSPR